MHYYAKILKIMSLLDKLPVVFCSFGFCICFNPLIFSYFMHSNDGVVRTFEQGPSTKPNYSLIKCREHLLITRKFRKQLLTPIVVRWQRTSLRNYDCA